MKDREPPSIWSGWNLPSAVTILHDPAARLLHSTLWSLSGRSSQTPLLFLLSIAESLRRDTSSERLPAVPSQIPGEERSSMPTEEEWRLKSRTPYLGTV